MLSTNRRRRLTLSLVAALALATPAGLPAVGEAKKAKKPKTTKIKHVGSFDDMPGSQVSFTVVKKGKKPVKVINVRVDNVSLICWDESGRHARPFSTTYPDLTLGRAMGSVGFAVSDIRLHEFEWGYKSIFGTLSPRARAASGDVRIRFEQGELGCGGQYAAWRSRAR